MIESWYHSLGAPNAVSACVKFSAVSLAGKPLKPTEEPTTEPSFDDVRKGNEVDEEAGINSCCDLTAEFSRSP
jgi:hypothetical protein